MNEIERAEFRVQRLEAAIQRITNGDRTAFGRKLGYKDGAFVRQMLAGTRTVTEKTIRAIEDMPGMRGWFDEQPTAAAPAQSERSEMGELTERYGAASDAERAVVQYILHRSSSRPPWMTPALASMIDTAIALVEEKFPTATKPTGTGTGTRS